MLGGRWGKEVGAGGEEGKGSKGGKGVGVDHYSPIELNHFLLPSNTQRPLSDFFPAKILTLMNSLDHIYIFLFLSLFHL